MLLCRSGTNTDNSVWVNSFVQFQFFASGALLALWLHGRALPLIGSQRCLLITLGLGMFVLAQHTVGATPASPPPTFFPFAARCLLVNAGCIVLFLGFLGSPALGRAKTLTYLGKISYGLYAFHFGALLWCDALSHALMLRLHLTEAWRVNLSAALALALTVGLASLSYRFFEAPLLRLKRRFEIIQTRSA